MMNQTRPRPKAPRYFTDPLVFLVIICVGFGIGGFGWWSATAQLAQGITASGVLVVKDRRRTVQHLEGGIISAIHIREGQMVAQGDVLIELSDANAQARLIQVRADIAARTARLDRLEAVLENSNTLTFTRLHALAHQGPDSAALIRAETQVFSDQRADLDGRRALVQAKIERLYAEENSLISRQEGKQRELENLKEELAIQEDALAQQIGNISRLNEVKRAVTVAESTMITLQREGQVIQSSLAEAAQELDQIDLTFRAEAAKEITIIRAELLSLNAEQAALEDRQTRRQLVAPISGVIIDLKYPAIGGVVPPGEAIFDIVPSERIWRVDVKFDPKDRDNLAEGRDVNLRFGTLDPINPPETTGVLDIIAADATLDVQAQIYYYSAEVSIPDDQLNELQDFTLSPGIPVEVFMDSGTTRTPLSYFIEPIEVMLRLGMRG